MRFICYSLYINCAVVLISSPHVKASSLQNDIADILSQRFSATVLLTDSDAIEFGVGSFNPNDYVNINNDNLGSAQALAERRNKSLYLLPYTHRVASTNANASHLWFFKAYSLRTRSEFSLFDNTANNDVLDESVLGLAVGYGYRYSLNDNFNITPKLSSHLMHYTNRFSANSVQSEIVEVFFEGSLFNTSAWSNVYEPSIGFEYDMLTVWGNWMFTSTWSYFYGFTWGEANNGKISDPHGWYVTNQVTWRYDVFDGSTTPFVGFKRVDLSSALRSELSTEHYYETSFGWLFNRPTDLDWIDNIGIGINLNYGSSLRGGSISLYYNK